MDFQSSTDGLPTPTGRAMVGGERGQALAEEALILVLIAVVAVAALTAMQGSIADTLGSVSGSLGWLAPDDVRSGE